MFFNYKLSLFVLLTSSILISNPLSAMQDDDEFNRQMALAIKLSLQEPDPSNANPHVNTEENAKKETLIRSIQGAVKYMDRNYLIDTSLSPFTSGMYMTPYQALEDLQKDYRPSDNLLSAGNLFSALKELYNEEKGKDNLADYLMEGFKGHEDLGNALKPAIIAFVKSIK